MQAYKKYVTMILSRVNTITNVTYSHDPTIFALELANEPHTTDNYEKDQNIQPGSLIKGWIKEVVAHIRMLDKNHMVSEHGMHAAYAVDKGCRLLETCSSKLLLAAELHSSWRWASSLRVILVGFL